MIADLHQGLEQGSAQNPFLPQNALRQTARSGFYDPGDFTGYYQGLTIYLLSAPKFRDLDEVPEAKQIAFWGAATLRHLLRTASPRSADRVE